MFGQLHFLAGKSNRRAFGALKFRRLLRQYLFGRREKIPLNHGASVKMATSDEPDTHIFDEPMVSHQVFDGLLTEETEQCQNVSVEIPEEFYSKITDEFYDEDLESTQSAFLHPNTTPLTAADKSDDFLLDEFAVDVEIHIAGQEGFATYSGWLGKGTKRM